MWRELRVWIRDDVLPVIHRLVKRRTFQERASWVLETLVNSPKSAERLLLNEVDALLVQTAKQLSPLLESKSLRKGLADTTSKVRVTSETIHISEGSNKVIARTAERIDRLDENTSRVRQIARRFWTDLVSNEDYFEPQAQWLQKEAAKIQCGDFVVSCVPELHQGGDFVSRCAIWRIELLMKDLEEAGNFLARGFSRYSIRTSMAEKWKDARRLLGELRRKAQLLRHRLLEEEGQPLRDACILLTQVGAALSSDIDLSWLDVPTWTRAATTSIRRRVERQQNQEIFDRIAAALSALQAHYALQDPKSTSLDEAIAGKGLVLDKTAQESHWKGEKIATSWTKYPKEWMLLVRLAETGRHGGSVDNKDQTLFFDDAPGRSTLATLCSRLKRDLPADLAKLIIPGRQPGSYKIDLKRLDISVFE